MIRVKHFFSFKGRTTRFDYWLYIFLSLIAICILAGLGEILAGLGVAEDSLALLFSPVILAIFYTDIAVTAKRLHDTNRSGLNMLWGLVPIFGLLYLFVVCGFLRDIKPNKYGEPIGNPSDFSLTKEILTCIPLIPKALWRFTLNRVRELGKAFRDES